MFTNFSTRLNKYVNTYLEKDFVSLQELTCWVSQQELDQILSSLTGQMVRDDERVISHQKLEEYLETDCVLVSILNGEGETDHVEQVLAFDTRLARAYAINGMLNRAFSAEECRLERPLSEEEIKELKYPYGFFPIT